MKDNLQYNNWAKITDNLIEKNSLVISEQIVRHILDKITKGELSPGDILPSEKQLIEIYDVSRGCVREALRTLQIMNVITIQQGKGAFITSLDVSLLVQHLEFVFTADADAMFYVFDVRKMLEPQIAALAAVRITDAELEHIYKLVKKDDDHDREFHQMLASAAKNPILDRVVSSIWSLSEISRSQTSVIPGVRDKAHAQHLKIVNALEEHDAQKARQLMCEHLEFVESSLKQELTKKANTKELVRSST